MTTITSIHDLFVDMLQDIYYAEKKILKALPKMAKSLEKNSPLAAAFIKHEAETEGQVKRLEQVFASINEKPKAKKCDAIEGIAEEADALMEEVDCKATLEAGLLAGAQAVEHYEMARYGTLVAWAKIMGHSEAAKLLQQTLEEEKKTDSALNKLAVDTINRRAFDMMIERQKSDDDTVVHHATRHRAA